MMEFLLLASIVVTSKNYQNKIGLKHSKKFQEAFYGSICIEGDGFH